jgi:heterodisulfide reductase subunit C
MTEPSADTPQKALDWAKLDFQHFRQWDYSHDMCMACGMCASACPAAGIDDFDPRKIVRMLALGQEAELVDSRWPWICTMCGKCENICPMGIDIADAIRQIRALRNRDNVPGHLHQGLTAALETGNNLRLPKEDYLFILEDVGEELAEEEGFEGFTVPVDQKGARVLCTIHNKLVNTHTDDLKHWWKIFHVAGESWTVAGDNWEGTSWGYFTGDDEAMKVMAKRILDQMEELEIDTLLWPE